MTNQALRFGIVPYLNAIPLVTALKDKAPGCSLIPKPPRELAAALLNGTCDAALVPIADLVVNPRLEILTDLGVAAKGRVGSVLLRSQIPIDEINTVQLDPESSTSNALARIILTKHYKLKPKLIEAGGAGKSTVDAEVVIGDRALRESGKSDWVYDLAAEWHTMTKLPFVFAAWAVCKDQPNRESLCAAVNAAWQSGKRALPLLAQVNASRLGLPIDRCVDYLTRLIHHELTAEDHKAIATFKKHLQAK